MAMDYESVTNFCANSNNDVWNGILIGSTGGFVAGLALFFVTLAKDEFILWRDKQTIYKYLSKVIRNSSKHKWKSSKTIASFTNLPKDRVTYVCSKHIDIVMNTGDNDDMWGVKGISRL